jgi:hypothetical protein
VVSPVPPLGVNSDEGTWGCILTGGVCSGKGASVISVEAEGCSQRWDDVSDRGTVADPTGSRFYPSYSSVLFAIEKNTYGLSNM